MAVLGMLGCIHRLVVSRKVEYEREGFVVKALMFRCDEGNCSD